MIKISKYISISRIVSTYSVKIRFDAVGQTILNSGQVKKIKDLSYYQLWAI